MYDLLETYHTDTYSSIIHKNIVYIYHIKTYIHTSKSPTPSPLRITGQE